MAVQISLLVERVCPRCSNNQSGAGIRMSEEKPKEPKQMQTRIRFKQRGKYVIAQLMPPEGVDDRPVLLAMIRASLVEADDLAAFYRESIDKLWVTLLRREFGLLKIRSDVVKVPPDK